MFSRTLFEQSNKNKVNLIIMYKVFTTVLFYIAHNILHVLCIYKYMYIYVYRKGKSN